MTDLYELDVHRSYIYDHWAAPLAPGDDELPQPGPHLGYLSETDLTPELMAETLYSYAHASQKYGDEVEWTRAGIKVMIEKVVLRYKSLIERHKVGPNGEKPRMLIAGAGTLMLAILFRLINDDWQVDAYDALQEMLDEGVRRMTLEYILALSEIAAEVDPSLGGVIKMVDELAGKFEEQVAITKRVKSFLNQGHFSEKAHKIQEEIEEVLAELVNEVWTEIGTTPEAMAQNLLDSIFTFQATHENLAAFLEGKDWEYLLIDATGTYTHVQKLPDAETGISPLDESIATALSVLADGGEYHFSLKVDLEAPDDVGRVSYDNDLGSLRYFSTLSILEINLLKDRIESGALQCSPKLKNKLKNFKFKVEVGEISPHAVNPLKPPFANLFVTRIA